ADDDDDQIGREVVGAMDVQRFSAMLAGMHGLQPGAEQPALAAIGTLAEKAAQHGRAGLPRRTQRLVFAAEDLLCHHRLLFLGPERDVRPRVAPRSFFALWNERLPPGKALGSLSISARMAPAIGATSTSRTSTGSAS